VSTESVNAPILSIDNEGQGLSLGQVRRFLERSFGFDDDAVLIDVNGASIDFLGIMNDADTLPLDAADEATTEEVEQIIKTVYAVDTADVDPESVAVLHALTGGDFKVAPLKGHLKGLKDYTDATARRAENVVKVTRYLDVCPNGATVPRIATGATLNLSEGENADTVALAALTAAEYKGWVTRERHGNEAVWWTLTKLGRHAAAEENAKAAELAKAFDAGLVDPDPVKTVHVKSTGEHLNLDGEPIDNTEHVVRILAAEGAWRSFSDIYKLWTRGHTALINALGVAVANGCVIVEWPVTDGVTEAMYATKSVAKGGKS
jgi:hypothetical protein